MFTYKIYNIKLGLIFTLIVGIYSGLLGVGGGILSVPVMNKIMKSCGIEIIETYHAYEADSLKE